MVLNLLGKNLNTVRAIVEGIAAIQEARSCAIWVDLAFWRRDSKSEFDFPHPVLEFVYIVSTYEKAPLSRSAKSLIVWCRRESIEPRTY